VNLTYRSNEERVTRSANHYIPGQKKKKKEKEPKNREIVPGTNKERGGVKDQFVDGTGKTYHGTGGKPGGGDSPSTRLGLWKMTTKRRVSFTQDSCQPTKEKGVEKERWGDPRSSNEKKGSGHLQVSCRQEGF